MDLLVQSAFARKSSGFAWFLVGLRSGHDNKHMKKVSLEVIGGTLVGFFVSVPMIPFPEYIASLSCWHGLVFRCSRN